MGQADAAVDAAVFEVERFEWTADDRIELAGVWSGLRGRRFMRPTLVLTVEGKERRRLLATLEHKPWAGDEGVDWIAAFTWEGESVQVDSAELSVGSGIDLELPPPRRASGKKPTRRFKHRAVAREGSDAAPSAEPATAPKPKTSKPAKAAAPKAAKPSKPASPNPPESLKAGDLPKPAASAKAAEQVEDAEVATAEKARAESGLPAALERAAAAELRVRELEKERDTAVARRKEISAELTAARESHIEAVRDARAEERESASQVLAEGAELRASVERQREMAYEARDQAERERDEAIRAKDEAIEQRRQALADRKEAFRERDQALADSDHADRERQRALEARSAALAERDRANEQRDDAVSERDTIVSVHKRGLPVVPPQPRHLPAEPRRSDSEVWGPRAAAAGALFVALVVVLKMFAGL